MKKIILILPVFLILAATAYAQLSSPVLVEPPKETDVVLMPVMLDWQDVQGASCYRVELTTDPNSPDKFEAECNAPNSHFEIPLTETEPSTVYYWRVYACGSGNWSAPSAYSSFKTAGSNSIESIGNLIDGVIDLIADEDIPPNQGNILIHRIENAQDKLEAGNRFGALIQIINFKARVIILRLSNVITMDVYTSLNYSSDGVIDLIVDEEDNPNIRTPLDISEVLTPRTYSLSQNYPNPFNPSTTIEFSIPQSSNVSVKIYDIMGKEVATLVNEYRGTGSYIVNWNASGSSSGVYFYKLVAGSFSQTKKMILSK
jgi:Secretion system C-terminal sorting domain